VVLVGPPGAPCLAVAQEIGTRWAVRVVDSDELVAQAAGSSVGDLLLDAGEDAYRELERRAVVTALNGDGIVSLGSGAVVDPGTRSELAACAAAGGQVVMLDLPAGESARAAGLGAAGAAGLGPTRARWRAMYDERHTLLAEVATATVAAHGRTVVELADEVAALPGPARR
jgi:shikimate kinase